MIECPNQLQQGIDHLIPLHIRLGIGQNAVPPLAFERFPTGRKLGNLIQQARGVGFCMVEQFGEHLAGATGSDETAEGFDDGRWLRGSGISSGGGGAAVVMDIAEMHIATRLHDVVAEAEIPASFDGATFDDVLFIVIIARSTAFIADVDIAFYVNIRFVHHIFKARLLLLKSRQLLLQGRLELRVFEHILQFDLYYRFFALRAAVRVLKFGFRSGVVFQEPRAHPFCRLRHKFFGEVLHRLVFGEDAEDVLGGFCEEWHDDNLSLLFYVGDDFLVLYRSDALFDMTKMTFGILNIRRTNLLKNLIRLQKCLDRTFNIILLV